MADKDEIDSMHESDDPAADPSPARASGSHALGATEPAVSGVPADADEPTFRDRERLEAEGVDGDGSVPAGLASGLPRAVDGDMELDPDHEFGPDQEFGPDHTREPDDLSDGDRELVTVGAPPRKRKAGERDTGSTVVSKGRDKKDRSTPRQKQVAEKDRRTGPVTFVKESVSELQKVVYPTGQQLINYFIVVLIFVLFIIAIVSALDLAFGKAIIAIFS